MSICIRYTKNREFAKDVLQETFINVFKYIGGFEGRGSFDGWIKRIAVNCCLKFIKMHKPVYYTGTLEDHQNHNVQIPLVFGKLLKEDILKLMDCLPPSMYTIFNLSIMENYNHREISEMLNISERTSRSTLSRARNRLIGIMKEEENLFAKKNEKGFSLMTKEV